MIYEWIFFHLALSSSYSSVGYLSLSLSLSLFCHYMMLQNKYRNCFIGRVLKHFTNVLILKTPLFLHWFIIPVVLCVRPFYFHTLYWGLCSNAEGVCRKHYLWFPRAPPLLPACSSSPPPQPFCGSPIMQQVYSELEECRIAKLCLYLPPACCLNRMNAYLLPILVYINSVNVENKQTNKRRFAQAVKIETELQFLVSQVFGSPPQTM